MPLQIVCPNLRCRKILFVPNDARGKAVKCQHCQMVLKVPEFPPANPPPASDKEK